MTLHTFVCIAGLPEDAHRELTSRPARRFTGDPANPPIAFPLPPPLQYRAGHALRYLNELARRVAVVRPGDDVSVVLAFLEHAESADFVRSFHPFALARGVVPVDPQRVAKHERRHAVNTLANHVADTVDDLRTTAGAVRDALSGRNFSPLLLPLRNFRSRVFSPTIDRLFETLPTSTAEEARALLDAATAEIRRDHPLRTAGDDKWFEDDRRLRFRSPGRNRHGMARRSEKDHQPSCLVGARVRLGGSFDPLFHFDCQPDRGRLARTYPNCHDAPVPPADHRYVNIAPNDYVR